MLHSSGNYVITGRKDFNKLAVLVLNANGDSIWGNSYVLTMPVLATKTIETDNGGLAILGSTGWIGFPSKYVLVLDSIYALTERDESYKLQKIEVFPNPAHEVLYIKIHDNNFSKDLQIEIFNTLGQQIRSINVYSSFAEISLKENPSGIYLYKIRQNTKIVKQGKIILNN